MLKTTQNLAAFVLVALLIGCGNPDSGTDIPDSPVFQGSRVENPCAVFDEGIAESLGNGPYLPGQASASGASTTCYRAAAAKAPNLHGATARFEKMSRKDFLARACSAPADPETGRPLYEVELLPGYYEAACRFLPLSDGKVGLSVLTASGWAVMVGSAPEAECRAVVEKLVPNLPG